MASELSGGGSPAAVKKLDPLFEIWLHPRKTIAKLSNSISYPWIIVITFLAGVSDGFDRAVESRMGNQAELAKVIYSALLGGALAGAVMLLVGSLLLWLIAKIFKGQASFKQVVLAFAWARVPIAISAFLWIPLLVVYGDALFVTGGLDIMNGPPFFKFIGALMLALKLWAIVLLVGTLAEVEGFSHWWKALACVLIIVLLTMLLSILISLGGVVMKLGQTAKAAALTVQ